MSMPTGYTAAIAKDITFEQFVMGCSRAMGAMIMMRDEPSDAPIPERFEPSDYSAKKLAESQAELARLQCFTGNDATGAAKDEYAAAVLQHAEHAKKDAELRAKYDAMLARVMAWEAPTADHQGFKVFMVEQIKGSIRFDCGMEHYPTPEQKTGAAWLAAAIAKASKDIAYHSKAHAEEVERTEGRNAWLSALRASLTPVAK
jgi:hypothetical protein